MVLYYSKFADYRATGSFKEEHICKENLDPTKAFHL